MSPQPSNPRKTQTEIASGTGNRSFSDELLVALVPAVKELTEVMRQLAAELAAQQAERERATSFRREVRESVRSTLEAL